MNSVKLMISLFQCIFYMDILYYLSVLASQLLVKVKCEHQAHARKLKMPWVKIYTLSKISLQHILLSCSIFIKTSGFKQYFFTRRKISQDFLLSMSGFEQWFRNVDVILHCKQHKRTRMITFAGCSEWLNSEIWKMQDFCIINCY